MLRALLVEEAYSERAREPTIKSRTAKIWSSPERPAVLLM